MKQAILTILARLVNAMKAASVPFHSLVIPIIKGAVEPGSETQLYLLEDALDLWSAILVQSPAPASPELLSLAPYLFAMFELGSENLRKALEITQSYVLLAPSDMLSDSIREPLLASLASVIGKLKPEANGLVNNLIEIILRAAEALGGEDAIGKVTRDLVECRFLIKQLEGLRGSWMAHCSTGPNAKEPPVDGIVETDYFSVLARVVLGSVPFFLQAVQAAAPPTGAGSSLEETMKWLLEEWFSHLDNIGDPSRRKLMCLALTKLLSSNQPWILDRLQQLMDLWTTVLIDVRDEDAQDIINSDTLVYGDPAALKPTDVPEAPEDERRRQLTFSDPVHTISTPVFVRHYLQQAVQMCGGQDAFQREWLVNVDQDVVAGFSKLGVF